jgi:uncharacterized protein
MSAASNSFTVRFLTTLSRGVIAHPGWFAWPQLALFGACVWFTVARLEFDLDRNALVGSDQPYHRNFLALKDEFPGQDDLVCVVESEDPEKNRQFVERLGSRLDRLSTQANPSNLFTDVFYKGDLKMLGRKALLFVPETNLFDLKQTLVDYQPFIQQFGGASNLVTLFQRINTTIRTSSRETNATTTSLLKALPALTRIIQRAKESLGRPGTPPSPGIDALFGAGDEAERDKYVTFAEGRIYLVTAKARTEDLNQDAVDQFRVLVKEVTEEVPGVNVGITGEPVLEYDEMQQSQKDSTKASIVSLLLCATIFIVGYRGTGRPLKAVFCLVIGLGYTMGYTTLVIGHLNILTITFVPMLIGLAIDYGVHLITRYEEEIRRGRDQNTAMETAMVFTGHGILTGCLTTAGAFFAMSLTHFRGIQEMGIITGGGMVICLIPMLTLLPVMLLRGRQNTLDLAAAKTPGDTTTAGDEFRTRLEQSWLRRPWWVLGITTALCGVAAVSALKVKFDYNLLNMQSKDLASVAFEKKLVKSSEKSVLYGAVVATNLDQAVRLQRLLTNLPSVKSIDSMATFLAEPPGQRLQLIRGVKTITTGLRFAEPDPAPVDLVNLNQTLYGLNGYLLLAVDEVIAAGETNLLADLRELIANVKTLRTAMFTGDLQLRPERAAKLGAYQLALFNDLRDTFDVLRSQDDSSGLKIEDLPVSLRNRFVGRTGKQLIQVYPKTDVWEREPQEVFVKELQSVDPNVTGTPVQLYYYTELLRTSYIEAAWWALGAIVLLVLYHFRSLSSVMLSLIPVGIGTLWVTGFMGWTHLAFNPANIMMLPLVIGIGVTNGIHMLNRYAEERSPGIFSKSTGKAVLVSGLNTIVGFGSLILGDHQGIQSLGWIMATGTAACMIAALTSLPAILTIRERWTSARQ